MNRRSYLKAIGATVVGGSIIGGTALQLADDGSDGPGEPPSEQPTAVHTPDGPGETATSEGTPQQESCELSHRGIPFDCAIDAVDDLGMDPTGSVPVDDQISFQHGALIDFPPGTYLFEKSHVVEHLKNWGVRGLGSDPSEVRFVAPPRAILRLFNIRSGKNVLMENITFDQRETRQGSLGSVVRVSDGLQMYNLKHTGFEPSQTTGTVSLLHPIVTDPKGTGIIDGYEVKMGYEHAPYPKNGISFWAGPPHKGTLTLRNVYIENLPGLYMSRTDGDVHVENCHFRNNDISAIRVCGEGSYVKNTKIEIDTDNSYNVVGKHDHNQGIRWESGFKGKTGGYIENVDIVCKSVNRSSGLVKVEGSAGALTIRDTSIRCDPDKVPIVTSTPPGATRAIDGKPSKPWNVNIDGLSVTGKSSAGDPAIRLYGRDNSVVRNSCIDIQGERNGILVQDANSCLIENTNIWVPGEYIVLKNATADTKGITHSKQCQ